MGLRKLFALSAAEFALGFGVAACVFAQAPEADSDKRLKELERCFGSFVANQHAEAVDHDKRIVLLEKKVTSLTHIVSMLRERLSKVGE